MDSVTSQEKRFASFILGGDNKIELAIQADKVLEAIPISGAIQPLPDAIPYLEGFMSLRNDTIPVINMKARLGLPVTDYAADAKVAVVTVFQLRLGLLFDDIQDVLVVASTAVDPIHPVLQTGDGIISDIIRLDNEQRTLELLDLKRLFGDNDTIEQLKEADRSLTRNKATVQQTYSRFVVFSSTDQDYGVPVEQVQEITFPSQIDDVFQNDVIEGALQLRKHTIPVLNATRLLQSQPGKHGSGEDTRVLVLDAESFQYGLIVDCVREILSIPDEVIMPLPRQGNHAVSGIYQRSNGRNIMLIQVDVLIEDHRKELRSMARLRSPKEEERQNSDYSQTRHLITADCYLIFSIGRNFAIELNDVQEIIEPKDLLEIPAETGFDSRVLNLRGTVVPVINLRAFYGYEEDDSSQEKRLIIARKKERVIAIEVDRILTIYKQVQFQTTPSLNPQLASRQDTLDRLIEYVSEAGISEHVLVVNIGAMMDNHLNMIPSNQFQENELEPKGEKQ